MSRQLSTLCSILFASLLLASIALVADREFLQRGLPVASSKAEPSLDAIDEDPAAREKWEWRTLHDPATGEIPKDARRREVAYSRTLPMREDGRLFKGGGMLSIPDNEWTNRGPYNIGGRTRALAIDIDDERTLLAGGITGGMWRSENAGVTWERTTPVGDMPSVTCITQDPRAGHHNVWYHGTGEWRTNSARFGNTGLLGDGISKSTDGGRSWERLGSTVSGTPQLLDRGFDFVWNIVVDRSNTQEDEIYAAVYGGIVRSTDGGTSWTSVLGGTSNRVGYTTVVITPSGVLYAGLGSGGEVSGIWRSPDGITWTNITPQDWSDTVRRITLALAPSNPNALYILSEGFENGFEINGVYGYKEYYSLYRYNYKTGTGAGGGGEWESRSQNLPSLGGNYWFFNGLNSYAMTLAVHPTDENLLYIGGWNLFRSRDACATPAQNAWLGGYNFNGGYNENTGLHPDVHTVQFLPSNPSRLYVGCDGGIFTTTEDLGIDTGLVWENLNHGYVTTQYYTVALDHQTAGSALVIGGLQDNGTLATSSTDPTTAWETQLGGDGSFCAIAEGGRTRYMSAQGGVVYRVGADSIGQVTNYTRVDAARPTAGRLFIHPFVLDPVDNRVMYMPYGDTIWRNDDLSGIPSGSYSPTTINWSPLAASTGGRTISAVAATASDPQHRLYYGTDDGRLYRLDDALGTAATAVNITGSEFPSGAYINCIAIDPLDGDHAFVVFTNYSIQSLFATTDGGTTWRAVGGNLEENPDGTGRGPSCRWGRIVHRGPDIHYFVGTTAGLYSTENLDGPSTTWAREGSATIGLARVDMIDARESDGMIAVATWGSGVFTRTLQLSGVTREADEERPRAERSRIVSIEPNPVRSRATITVRITEPTVSEGNGGDELSLYDLRGRLVRRLLRGGLDGGEHRVEFDRGGVAAGVYLLRLGRSEGEVVILP